MEHDCLPPPGLDPALLCGVDEAGRGPLAGPVVAAAVILDPQRPIPHLDDSKKLSPATRDQLMDIIQNTALAVAVGTVSVADIDRVNILQASLHAMAQAIHALPIPPAFVLVDGNRLPQGLHLPARAVIKGDARCPLIGAASIVAKVTRDRIMDALAQDFPGYGWERNRGYGTKAHLDALARLGPTPHHRRSFAPVRQCS